MAEADWFARSVAAGVYLAPVYLLLQVWFASAWQGRWRWVALVPVLGLLPAMAVAFAVLSHGGNQWPFALLLFTPVGCGYLLIAALVRMMLVRRRAA